MGILLVYERTVKLISTVSERTVGKDTINAGTRQLQESMKCVGQTHQKAKNEDVAYCTSAYKTKQTLLCKSCFEKEFLHDGCVVETIHS